MPSKPTCPQPQQHLKEHHPFHLHGTWHEYNDPRVLPVPLLVAAKINPVLTETRTEMYTEFFGRDTEGRIRKASVWEMSIIFF